MKRAVSLSGLGALCVCVVLSLVDEAKGDVAKLKASRATWEELKEKCGGNYRYFVRTSSFSGARTETEIVVQKNKVTGRRYKVTGGAGPVLELPVPGGAPAKPAAPEYKWTERGGEVGSNKGGAPAKTLDELYDDAEKVLAHALSPSEKRYFKVDGQGLLKSCFYVDTRIADDAPTTGVIIAEIRLDRGRDK